MMKKVSIIIPAYNKADLTVKTVDSVLNQTYPDIEVIVVDDGSTDKTRDRLSSFGDRIRYVYKKNGGACSARNLGIRLAAGEYIGFLDCDDMYLPQKVEKSVDYLEANRDLGFIHTPIYYIDENDAVLWYGISKSEIPTTENRLKLSPKAIFLRACPVYRRHREGWIANGLVQGNFVCNSTPVVRRSCFEKVGLFDESIFIPADWDMWLRLAEGYEAGYIRTPLTLYRTSKNYTPDHLEQSITEELAVVEKAVRRKPPSYLPFKNKLISNVHYRHAICYLSLDDFNKAKEEIALSVSKYIFNPTAVFLLIAITVMGRRLKLLRNFWHYLKVKISKNRNNTDAV